MGCRKNAYRALTEMSEWMEAQREKSEEKAKALAAAQRKLWTPASVFDQCCSKWLADGPEIQPSGCKAGSTMAAKGCSGACGKEHARVLLEWNTHRGVAVASVSHKLDPFVNYFEGLCREGFAKKSDSNELCFELNGFLKEHVDKMEQSVPFGMHLVKVTPEALAASQRAHKRHLEQEELIQQAKRRKLQANVSVNLSLLEQVLQICYDHSLSDHLDIAEIAWMRLSCKAMARVAAQMAKARMHSLKLSYSILLNGRVVPESRHVNRRESTFGEEIWGEVCDKKISDTHVERYILGLPSRQILKEHCTGIFHPDSDTRVTWQSPKLSLWGAGYGEFAVTEYRGNVVRLYLEPVPAQANGQESSCHLPEKECLFSSLVEIGRFSLDPANMKNGPGTLSTTVEYHVEGFTEDNTTTATQYKGNISIRRVRFGFSDLLGIYVCKKLPTARAEMRDKGRQRPVTRSEREYVKALAKAARESSVSVRDFVGFEGW